MSDYTCFNCGKMEHTSDLTELHWRGLVSLLCQNCIDKIFEENHSHPINDKECQQTKPLMSNKLDFVKVLKNKPVDRCQNPKTRADTFYNHPGQNRIPEMEKDDKNTSKCFVSPSDSDTFNLSDKIIEPEVIKGMGFVACPFLWKEDVEEFVRLLKDKLYLHKLGANSWGRNISYKTVITLINKLAGERFQ